MTKKYKVEVENDYCGYKYVIVLTRMGHRCGYVGVDKNHPLYGHEYDEKIECLRRKDIENNEIGKRGVFDLFLADWSTDEVTPSLYFDVHGGITYAGGGNNYPIESDLWWYGFDCAHCGDAGDLDLAYEYGLVTEAYKNSIQSTDAIYPTGGVVRSLGYVARECKSFIDQILKLGGGL